MKKILVPVDYSDISLKALLYAIRVFGKENIEITLLHTYKTPRSAFHMKSIDRYLKKDSEKEMEVFLEKVNSEVSGLQYKIKFSNASPIGSIIRKAKTGHYDYIAMGTKGVSGVKEVFIGSVAGGVISKSPIPVLIIPSTSKPIPLDEIVMAVSENPFSDPKVLDPLKDIASTHNSLINVVHISDDEAPDLSHVVEPIKSLNHKVTIAEGTRNIDQRLTDYLKKHNIGMLCLIRSKKGYLHRLFNASVTLKQTFHSPIPLLILRDG